MKGKSESVEDKWWPDLTSPRLTEQIYIRPFILLLTFNLQTFWKVWSVVGVTKDCLDSLDISRIKPAGLSCSLAHLIVRNDLISLTRAAIAANKQQRATMIGVFQVLNIEQELIPPTQHKKIGKTTA